MECVRFTAALREGGGEGWTKSAVVEGWRRGAMQRGAFWEDVWAA
jgi:hypothetical protein